jgi:hypothetical protein
MSIIAEQAERITSSIDSASPQRRAIAIASRAIAIGGPGSCAGCCAAASRAITFARSA